MYKPYVYAVLRCLTSDQILIDHNTKEGFEAIAGAREFLLELGRKDVLGGNTSPSAGSHVVAPVSLVANMYCNYLALISIKTQCPHDGACPLYFPGSIKLVCGFSQRIQRPEFVRRTKHSTLGHEDTGYSYVVIQRGQRPRPTIPGLGRTGAVGKWALERAVLKAPMRELQVHDEDASDDDSRLREAKYGTSTKIPFSEAKFTAEEVDEAIRREAYLWPRLVFPPLKKSGHIILDGCTAEGTPIYNTPT